MNTDLARRVLNAPRFASGRDRSRLRTVLAAMPAVRPGDDGEEPDWGYLLTCASFLVDSGVEEAQSAVLEVAHACLVSASAGADERAAAVVLLERLGNRPAARLAEDRGAIAQGAWLTVPPVALGVVRTRLELSVPSAAGSSFGVNRFQRDFWSAAQQSGWLSVSAPTAAGKSFIVRRWIQERLATSEEFRCVYVVPTRALIEEVRRELEAELGNLAGVRTLPWDDEIGSLSREVFVFTQERLHLLLQKDADFTVDLIFVDEAQKFGDDSRGVLLEQVLNEVVRRSNGSQIVFASPLSDNPEVLLEGSPDDSVATALMDHTVTVTQNLLWVNQVPRKPMLWNVELVKGDQVLRVGEVELPARPQPPSKRLPLVAVALGRTASSNVVYVNGPARAETTASQIYDALGEEADVSADPRVAALRELCQKTIHGNYALAEVVQRGVGFHYGSIPLLVRMEIERLFREGVLKCLVCTSTLLEGVNLPCQTLYVLGPERGRGNKMAASDFWNLAGRAGRWGQEFAGNIVCVDTVKRDKWPQPPRERVRSPLTRATDEVFGRAHDLIDYVARGTPPDEGDGHPPLEAVFSLLATRRMRGRPIEEIAGVPANRLEQLEAVVDEAILSVSVPLEIVERHAGISPVSMQRLLDDFESCDDPSELLVSPPESDDALETLHSAIGRIKRTLGGDFGTPPRQFGLARLITSWMRGAPLARLIANRIRYAESQSNTPKLATTIRNTMADVEKIARFAAPKYLACYLDLLRLSFERRGIADQLTDMPDVAMLLELGVSRTTELSMISLGLSRTTAVALSEHIVDDELGADECLRWLRERGTAALGLPILVQREITQLLERRPVPPESQPGGDG